MNENKKMKKKKNNDNSNSIPIILRKSSDYSSFSTRFSFWSNSPATFQGTELLVSFIGLYP